MDLINQMLPDSVFAQIFSSLKLTDKSAVRLVCRTWNDIFQEIETSITIKAHLSENNLNLNLNSDCHSYAHSNPNIFNFEVIKRCSLPITGLVVSVLTSPFDISNLSSKANMLPEALKEITFKMESLLDVSQDNTEEECHNIISNRNIIHMLQSAKYLEKLHFILTSTSGFVRCRCLPNFSESNVSLEHLTELTVEISHVGQVKLFSELSKIQIPFLRNLKMCFSSSNMYFSDPHIVGFILNGYVVIKEEEEEICQTYFDIYSLLIQHKSTLVNLSIIFPPVLEFNQEVNSKFLNQKIRQELVENPANPTDLQLKQIQLSFLGETEREEHRCDLGHALLGRQNSLESIGYVTTGYAMLGWSGYFTFLETVQRNHLTLKHITLINRLPDHWPDWNLSSVDMNSIATCRQLERLEIYYFNINVDVNSIHNLSRTDVKSLVLIGGMNPHDILPAVAEHLTTLEQLVFLQLDQHQPPPPIPVVTIDDDDDDVDEDAQDFFLIEPNININVSSTSDIDNDSNVDRDFETDNQMLIMNNLLYRILSLPKIKVFQIHEQYFNLQLYNSCLETGIPIEYNRITYKYNPISSIKHSSHGNFAEIPTVKFLIS